MTTRLLFAAVALAAGVASAQPASDLLQSAIYDEESLGDTDAAIRIYEQILRSPDLKVYAAQAQYRLGMCRLRQGDVEGARQALESVIRDYPAETVLVARARENMPPVGGLLPAPWRDGEVAEYRWTIPGVDNAWMISLIHSTANSELRLQTIFYIPALFFTAVDVEPKTMLPVTTTYRIGGTIIRQDYDRDAHTGTYDYGEVLQLLRRMPLAPGWKGTISRSSPPGRSPTTVTLTASVTGTDTITVPAGTFRCYRVQISGGPGRRSLSSGPGPELGDTLWYGVEGARPLVKIQRFVTMKGELVSLGTTDQSGSRSYRDPQVGYSFTVPPGWVFHPRPPFSGVGTSVDLVDPESTVWSIVSARPNVAATDDIAKELEAGAEARLAESISAWPDYTIRPGSRRTWLLDGRQALSWIADYTEGKMARVEYITWVQSESTRAILVTKADAADFAQWHIVFLGPAFGFGCGAGNFACSRFLGGFSGWNKLSQVGESRLESRLRPELAAPL
jgi:hypothetical protein